MKEDDDSAGVRVISGSGVAVTAGVRVGGVHHNVVGTGAVQRSVVLEAVVVEAPQGGYGHQ